MNILGKVKNIVHEKYLIVAGIIVCPLIVFFLTPRQDIGIINIITITGTFASIGGLLFALLQIKNVKQINKDIKNEVEKSISNFNLLLHVSSTTKSNDIIKEIIGYIKDGKRELAVIRLRDLKENIVNLKKHIDTNKYIDIINKLESMICEDKNRKSTNHNEEIMTLEKLSTLILEIEEKFKKIKK
jgi:hypothetical protein